MILSSSLFLVRRLKGWSNSTPSPFYITRIRSASMTVANRWAMISTVEFEKLCFSFCWITLSVSRSTLAVASSSTKILVYLKIALAKQINYFWPTENKLLLSETTVSSFSFMMSMWSNIPTSFKTFQIISSFFSLKGSRFSRILPCRRKGDWGMRAMFLRSAWRPTVEMSIPSISTDPESSSQSLNNA